MIGARSCGGECLDEGLGGEVRLPLCWRCDGDYFGLKRELLTSRRMRVGLLKVTAVLLYVVCGWGLRLFTISIG